MKINNTREAKFVKVGDIIEHNGAYVMKVTGIDEDGIRAVEVEYSEEKQDYIATGSEETMTYSDLIGDAVND